MLLDIENSGYVRIPFGTGVSLPVESVSITTKMVSSNPVQ